MKSTFPYVALAVLAGIAIPTKLPAQQGPSTAETIEWIRAHTVTPCPGMFDISIAPDGGVYFYSQIGWADGCDGNSNIRKDIVILKDVDSIRRNTERDDTGSWEIAFHTTTSSKTFDVMLSRSVSTDDADRIVKAFKHLAQLQGAKLTDDLF